MAPDICPNCGERLDGRDIVARGRYAYSERRGFSIDGIRLGVTPRVHQVIGALFVAKPTILPREIIADRLDYEGERPRSLLDVYLHRARRAFRDRGEDVPFKAVWGVGLQWTGA